MERIDKRRNTDLRPVSFQCGFQSHPAGSVLVTFGGTRVICAVSVEDSVPRWMKEQNKPGGWITAEYQMLPSATETRTEREAVRGKLSGRSSEIQRLIALELAAKKLMAEGKLTEWPLLNRVAAVSVGLLQGEGLLDLCYVEDSAADVDMNVIMTDAGRFVELQGSGEEATFGDDDLATLLGLAKKGLKKIFALQKAAVKSYKI